jgi:hypothetical protein
LLAHSRTGIVGWPRFAVLAIGSAILLALAIELSRKILHMEALSYLLKDLQEKALNLPEYVRFPLGVSNDIEIYRNYEKCKELQRKEQQEEKKVRKDYKCEVREKRRWAKNENKPIDVTDNLIFKFLKRFYARKCLLYVMFFAFLSVSALAILVFVDIIVTNYYHLKLDSA